MKLVAATLFVFLALGPCLYNCHYVFAQTDQTSSRLQAANNAVGQAFNAVLAAEKAGANITSLVNQLNEANSLLAQAENAYKAGDSTTAAKDVDAVLPIAQQVTTAAQTAKETASTSKQTSFLSTITITAIAAVVFVLALLIVWRLFKRNYIKGLSEAKPEVNTQ